MVLRLALVLLALLPGCAARAACEAETTACGCYARGASCKMVTESCWCPSACDSRINCVCGGGKFLRCEAPKQGP